MKDIIKSFLQNIFVFLFLLGVLVCVFFYIALPIITRHDEAIIVPNVIGLTVDEANLELLEKRLRYEVSSSSIYKPHYPVNNILEQHPKPGATVKRNRTIYLTINTNNPKYVSMPNLVDNTIRNAYMVLKSNRLILGKIEYVQDIAHNCVLEQYYKDKKISPGKNIEIGSSIDLLVGINGSITSVIVPVILNNSLEEMELFLIKNNLRLGNIVYEDSIRHMPGDIIGQNPLPKEVVCLGTKIDVLIASTNSSIKEEASLDEQRVQRSSLEEVSSQLKHNNS
jgi:beta-lactam-binding protein with PASTA domain